MGPLIFFGGKFGLKDCAKNKRTAYIVASYKLISLLKKESVPAATFHL